MLLKVKTVWQRRRAAGSEFHLTGAATAKARFASSVRVRWKTRCGVSEEHTVVKWLGSFFRRSARYGGSKSSAPCRWWALAILHSMRCLIGSQWSERRSGFASDRPRHWQTTLARLEWICHCSRKRLGQDNARVAVCSKSKADAPPPAAWLIIKPSLFLLTAVRCDVVHRKS